LSDTSDQNELSDEEKRYIRLNSRATYEALKRLDDEKKLEAQNTVPSGTVPLNIVPEPTEPVEVEPLPEAKILYRHRLHWVQLLGALTIVNILIVAVLSFGVCWVLEIVVRENLENTLLARTPGLVTYIFPLLPAVITVVVAIIRLKEDWRQNLHDLIMWFSERWVIDTYEIRHIVNVPGVFLNFVGQIEDIEAKIPRSAVIDPLVSQSWVGEILDFGTLSLGSASEQNTQFKNIRYLPRPKKLKEILGLNQGE